MKFFVYNELVLSVCLYIILPIVAAVNKVYFSYFTRSHLPSSGRKANFLPSLDKVAKFRLENTVFSRSKIETQKVTNQSSEKSAIYRLSSGQCPPRPPRKSRLNKVKVDSLNSANSKE